MAATVFGFLLTLDETFLLGDRLIFVVAFLVALAALYAFDVPFIAALTALDARPPPGMKLEAMLMAAPAFWYHFVFLLLMVLMSSPMAKL
ncbi:hypothetical protein [Cytobacillus horneckiae]|uniref:hypothetical protein n=1 Tax=Cytobacillus horneckiae TaxID=549687 RepID=UPI003D9A34D7